MNNPYINFWQNAFTDIFDTEAQLKKIDKIVEQSLSSYEDFTSMINKLGHWESFFKPTDTSLFAFKKNFDEYLKTMGMISIDEYRSLVKKYDELKKEHKNAETIKNELEKKIIDLNQSLSNGKKKLSTHEKKIVDSQGKQDELKELADSLKKDLTAEKKQNLALKTDLEEMKKLVDAMKKEIAQKEKSLQKADTAKA